MKCIEQWQARVRARVLEWQLAHIGVVRGWSERVAAEHMRVMLERDGLAGFHRPAPRRWPARKMVAQ